MRTRQYMLDENRQVIPCSDIMEWGRWFEKKGNRVVKQEEVGELFVSTVFLGLDHSFGERGQPVLWETMVFKGRNSRECDRCAGTWEDALAMHDRMVEAVRKGKA